MRRLHSVMLGAVLGTVLLAPAAGAEMVLFTHGDWLQVEGFELVDGDRVRLELPEGGMITVPILRIERVLDDEVISPGPLREPPAPVFTLRFSEQPPPQTPFGELIFATARRHRLNPDLVAAVVGAESAYRADAVSHKGARGLMQLMPGTAARFGVDGDQVLDPARNLDAGSRYLSWLIDRFEGELPLVLAAYNAGEGNVDRYRGVPPYRETRDYIGRVYANLGLEPGE